MCSCLAATPSFQLSSATSISILPRRSSDEKHIHAWRCLCFRGIVDRRRRLRGSWDQSGQVATLREIYRSIWESEDLLRGKPIRVADHRDRRNEAKSRSWVSEPNQLSGWSESNLSKARRASGRSPMFHASIATNQNVLRIGGLTPKRQLGRKVMSYVNISRTAAGIRRLRAVQYCWPGRAGPASYPAQPAHPRRVDR